MTQRAKARLAAAADHAALRQRSPAAFSSKDVEVDAEAGVIKNVAIMTIGPALGHGFDIDATSLDQLAALINATPDGLGVKSRFTHPGEDPSGQPEDDLGMKVGRVSNARVVGDSVRGDVRLGNYSSNLPGYGDVRSYLLGMAQEDPALLGMSAVIAFETDPQMDAGGNVIANPARIIAVDAVDFVGRPAANPNGLLSAKTTAPNTKTNATPHAGSAPSAKPVSLSKKGNPMDESLKALLVGAGHCDADATNEEAQTAYDGLSADDKAAIDAKHKEKMSAKTPTTTPAAASMSAKLAADTDAELVKMEAKRSANIRSLAASLKTGNEAIDAAIDTAALTAIGEAQNLSTARLTLLNAIKDAHRPVAGTVSVGDDKNISSLISAIPQALAMRWCGNDGMTVEKLNAFEAREKRDRPARRVNEVYLGRVHDRANELKHMSLKEMFKTYLGALGFDASRTNDVQLSEMMGRNGLRRANARVAALAESTSDFSAITLDAINKAVRFFYLDAPITWNKWAQRVTNPDFKTRYSIVLSESPSMISRNEGGEIKYVTLSDGKESYQVVEYTGGIKLTRRAILNDDKNCFASIPRLLTNAATRLEEDTAYGLLTNGTSASDPYAMADGTAVFDATSHGNYTSSGTALSIASLQVGETAIATQKGPQKAAFLELKSKFLLVPTSIKRTAEQFMKSDRIVTGNTTPQGDVNPFAGAFEVISSARLNANSAVSWYLAADYRDGQVNTAEMCFLEDEPEPVIRQETDFDTEDVKFAQRHTLAGKIVDYRGFYKNAGA